MRHCPYCGDSMGEIDSRYWERSDSCGKLECTRMERDTIAEEREQAHEQLDRDMGWER